MSFAELWEETSVSTPALPDPAAQAAGSCGDTPRRRAQALADRLEQGARVLAVFALALTDVQWQTRVPKDGHTIGVLVHHVASVYPLEIQLAQTVAAGQAVTGVTLDDIREMNATHAKAYDAVSKEAALELLRHNSTAAATAIRAMSDHQLDCAAAVSLYGDAPLTCQFVLEDRAVRHAYHHLACIRKALKAHDDALARLKQQLEAQVEVDQQLTCRP